MHSQFASSTSNPISFPSSDLEFHGGYAPSVAILIVSADRVELNRNIEAKILSTIFFNFIIFPP